MAGLVARVLAGAARGLAAAVFGTGFAARVGCLAGATLAVLCLVCGTASALPLAAVFAGGLAAVVATALRTALGALIALDFTDVAFFVTLWGAATLAVVCLVFAVASALPLILTAVLTTALATVVTTALRNGWGTLDGLVFTRSAFLGTARTPATLPEGTFFTVA